MVDITNLAILGAPPCGILLHFASEFCCLCNFLKKYGYLRRLSVSLSSCVQITSPKMSSRIAAACRDPALYKREPAKSHRMSQSQYLHFAGRSNSIHMIYIIIRTYICNYTIYIYIYIYTIYIYIQYTVYIQSITISIIYTYIYIFIYLYLVAI